MPTSNPNRETTVNRAAEVRAVKAGLSATGSAGGANWLRFTDADYDANAGKWQYIHDHLAGLVLDEDVVGDYLIKRAQGEHDDAYDERVSIADYTPHFSRAVISLAGMLWAVEEDTARAWGPFGDPEDPDSPAARLLANADGRGTNLETLHQTATVDLIGYHRLYGMVEGVVRDGNGRTVSEPSIRLLPPQSVLRVIRDGARIVSAKVKSRADVSESQREKPNVRDRYFIYEPDGFEVWEENKENKPSLVAEKRPYARGFQYLDESGAPTVPIVEVQLPFRTHIGYLMARKANSIFNHENTLDFLLWVACFPKLFADVSNPRDGSFDTAKWEALKKALADGNNVLPGAGNKFDAPPMAPSAEKRAAIAEKIAGFYATFFQSYGDAAREKTATEIRQDRAAGVEAFLTLLATAVDEFENRLLRLLAQAHGFPRGTWDNASVSRPKNFQPVHIDDRLDRLILNLAPSGLRVDNETQYEIVKAMLESNGFPVPPEREAALREAIASGTARDAQARSALADFNIAE